MAQDKCYTLDSNKKWNNGINKLVDMMQSNEMDNAWLLAKELSEICSMSPALNFLTGKIAQARNDTVSALYYYQKASEYTYMYAVEPDTAKAIWYARYLAENPDKTDESIDELRGKIRDLETETARLKESETKLNDEIRETEILMWSGAGTGAAGLALAATGIALVLSTKDEPCDISLSTENHPTAPKVSYKVNDRYIAGWALTGVGSALLVAGAVVAGIYGYRYSEMNSEVDLSINFTPASASLTVNF